MPVTVGDGRPDPGVDQVTRKRDLGTDMCPVEFRAPAFEVWAREVAEREELGALRDVHAPSWTVQRDRGQVFFLPLTSSAVGLGPPQGTTKTKLETAGNLRLLARLTTNALIRAFLDYEPLRRKPFPFLGRQRQLLASAAQDVGIDHPLLADFRIWPKYSLDARIAEVRDGAPFVAIMIDIATRWEIVSDLDGLQRAGIAAPQTVGPAILAR